MQCSLSQNNSFLPSFLSNGHNVTMSCQFVVIYLVFCGSKLFFPVLLVVLFFETMIEQVFGRLMIAHFRHFTGICNVKDFVFFRHRNVNVFFSFSVKLDYSDIKLKCQFIGEIAWVYFAFFYRQFLQFFVKYHNLITVNCIYLLVLYLKVMHFSILQFPSYFREKNITFNSSLPF